MILLGWYIVLAVTSIFAEEISPVSGGLAVHDNSLHLHLHLAGVGLSVALGTYSADLLLYYLGRWRGHWVRNKWPRVRTFMLRALRLVRRHPWRSSLSVRYAYGLRFTLPIACGAARIPFFIYAVGAAISAVTWSFLFAIVGWGFGRTALLFLGHVRRYERYLFASIIIAVLIIFMIMRRKHVENEVVEVLATGDAEPAPKITVTSEFEAPPPPDGAG